MLNFLNVDLPPHNNGTVSVKVSCFGDPKHVSVESAIDVQSVGSLQDALLRPQPSFRIAKFLGYFKLVNKDPQGHSDVLIDITYSRVAWALAIDKGEPYPKVAYLERRRKTWVGDWILFDAKDPNVEIEVEEYGSKSPYITLKIRHRHLPDPLIGGC